MDCNFGMADALQNAMQKDEPKFTDPIRGEMVCFASSMISTNGVWQGDDPFEYSLPLFILQLMLIVVITRILIFLLKPLRQPKVISEILGGVILDPLILGRCANFSVTIFPLRSIKVLETLANVGLLFLLFLVGVEMDLGMIRKTSQKAMVIAIACMSLPFLIGSSTTFLFNGETQVNHLSFVVFMGVALSVTAFPVLARILAELKLLNTEIGKMAMSAAMIKDICAWILLALAIALVESNSSTTLASFYVIFVVRPGIEWGLRTDISSVNGKGDYGFFITIIVLACVGKVAGTLLIALYYKMPFREAFVLALLMNTKGLTEMVVLNVVLVTGMIMPTVVAIYKPVRGFITHKRRTIQRLTWSAELRVLTCIHTTQNVPSAINLLEISNPTKKFHIAVYVLQLVELTGRTSAMLIVHNTHRVEKPAIYKTQVQSEQIINSLENLQQHVTGLSIHPLTAISPYSTMHEDICSLAEDERVTFIILPFHKQQAVDGGMEATNPVLRNINQNVLANAPCSVGILIDRGLGGLTKVAVSQISRNIAVLFFGGPDDREALSYALRMARHPGVSLTIFRFLPGEDAVKPKRNYDNFTNEKFINNAEETVAAVRSMENIHDLYIVGRGQGMISPLIAGLNDWSECPELGAIGDLLASSDLATTISVLVVQHYVGGSHEDGLRTPDS
ncbi:hypothetical protein GIB67_017168 [Kingdonia uniflora]|uniref:Cation/H+ exchanger domain-containing protein n=1 Tax=Kingdonia uniflora TaxID=39325 RepID=A0A7J7PAU3_9MAGN|nr:hypothetical protein GIB67_017168 [Kingdonia uniflora]